MNATEFIQNTYELRSFSARLATLYPNATNAKTVRDAAFAELQKDGRIPPAARVGWLTNPGRRKGCSPEADKWLDGLNRIFNLAKYHFGEDGKKSKAAERRNRNEPTQYVSYLRVSTRQQGKSGLGLESQRIAIAQYIRKEGAHILQEYKDVITGREGIQPQLEEALKHCRVTGATLIVAELDRLSRNAHFVTGIQEAGIQLVIAEHPHAPPEYIAMLAVRAQFDDKRKNTKAALALSPKPKGVKGPENLLKDPGSRAKGGVLGVAAIKANADERALIVFPLIKPLLQEGLNHSQIAQRLNAARVLSARGKHGKWTAQSVRSIVVRAAALLLITAPDDTERWIPEIASSKWIGIM